MKSKVAIVGCATHTRDDVDYSDPDLDIWVFNESAQKDWCKRADAVFQLHEPAIWKSPLNRGDKEHGKWLMSGNTPTIYMIEQYDEVPKCVRLPREDIIEKLIPNLTVDSERGRKDYFTSTIAYAIAMATYLGYKEIHTYGVELADESEYREQQPAAMFWTGVALGRGIKWVSHSQMFDCPLYPLESYIGMPLDEFSKVIAELTPSCNIAKDKYKAQKDVTETAIRQFEEAGSGRDEMVQAIMEQTKVGRAFGELDGARQENERYYGRGKAMEDATTKYVFSKHEFIRDMNAIGARREQLVEQITTAAANMNKIIENIEPKTFDSARRRAFKDLRGALEAYVKVTVIYGMYTGAIKEDERFIKKMEELKAEMKQNV